MRRSKHSGFSADDDQSEEDAKDKRVVQNNPTTASTSMTMGMSTFKTMVTVFENNEKKSQSTWRAKQVHKSSLKMPKMVQLGEFLKT